MRFNVSENDNIWNVFPTSIGFRIPIPLEITENKIPTQYFVGVFTIRILLLKRCTSLSYTIYFHPGRIWVLFFFFSSLIAFKPYENHSKLFFQTSWVRFTLVKTGGKKKPSKKLFLYSYNANTIKPKTTRMDTYDRSNCWVNPPPPPPPECLYAFALHATVPSRYN